MGHTAYSISREMVRQIREDSSNIECLNGIGDDEKTTWEVEEFYFEDLYETVRIFYCNEGSPTGRALDLYSVSDHPNYLEYEGDLTVFMPPSEVKIMLKEIENVTLDELRTKGLAVERTNDRGERFLEHEYETFADIDGMRTFFTNIVNRDNFLFIREEL